MSALAKPMVHSTKTTGTVQPLNAEHIVNFNVLDVPPRANSTKTRYQITFTYNSVTAPKDIRWEYDNAVDRDADHTALIALLSAAL
jgi:hypothetical protein